MGRIIDDATLTAIENEMRGDGVWIDPEFARAQSISAADETRLESLVASSDADLRILLVDVDSADDRFQGRFSNVAAWVHDSVGGDATYVGYERYGSPSLTLETHGDQPETYHVADMAARAEPDDFVEQVVRAEQYLEDGNASAEWDALPREEKYPWTADEENRTLGDLASDVGEGLSTGEWIAVGIGGVMVVLLVAVIWAAVRAVRRTDDFVLPTAVLRSVRAAEDRQNRSWAEREVLALGEALAAQSPSKEADAATWAAWQAALDHYDASRSVLDRAGSPADVVGALVLARRGESARVAALAETRTPWEPTPTCWFHPLHSGEVRRVTWRDENRSVEVPACPVCRRDVEADRDVADPLDFVDGDVTRHYYRLPLGAWSRTGYGSVEPDLLGALRRDGAQRRGRGVLARLLRR